MRTETFQRGFLLLLTGAVSAVFLWMVRDFLITLLFGAIFASLARPLYLRLCSFTRGRRWFAAGLTLAAFVILVFLPLFGFVGVVARQAVKLTEDVKPWVQENMGSRRDINDNLRKIPGYRYISPYRGQITQRISSVVGGMGNYVFQQVSSLTAVTVVFFLNFALMLYAMFFFLIDGPAMLSRALYYVPLESRDERRILEGFRSMARATIKGLAVVGVIQGGLAGLALGLAGIPSSLFWATLMAVFSILPNIGCALVWLPACVYLFLTGKTLAGILVLSWCSLVVASVDNILRPILVGKDTRMHELLVLVSTLGGMALMGLEGFLLGPVLAMVFLTVWDIYGAAFKDVLPRPEPVPGELEMRGDRN
jgi:predicted PurR-regulated permease PerM